MSQSHVVLEGSDRVPLPGAQAIGSAHSNEPVEVTVKVRRKAQLPILGNRPRPISQAELSNEYGADQADIDEVRRTLEQYGLKVLEANPGTRSVKLLGTVDVMQKAFQVKLIHYKHERGDYRGRRGPLQKSRFAIVWGNIAVILSLNRPMAVWAFQSLGGIIVDNPSCANSEDGTGDVTCAAKGTDNSLHGIRFNPKFTFSTGFESLGGIITGDPSCASPEDGTGDVTCAAKGTDNSLHGIRFNPKFTFSTGFKSLGGVIVDDPGCASAEDGTGDVTCAAKGTDNSLHGIRFNPKFTFSTGFKSLGGVIVDDPGCASAEDGTGDVTCAAKGTDNSLHGIRFNPKFTFSTGFKSLGGIIVDDPSCASDGTGQVVCGAKGTSNSLFGIIVNP